MDQRVSFRGEVRRVQTPHVPRGRRVQFSHSFCAGMDTLGTSRQKRPPTAAGYCAGVVEGNSTGSRPRP